MGSRNNDFGECGFSKDVKQYDSYRQITFFKQNGINIHKICTNIFGKTTFFISDRNKVYACGQYINQNLKTPTLIPHLQNVIDAKSNH